MSWRLLPEPRAPAAATPTRSGIAHASRRTALVDEKLAREDPEMLRRRPASRHGHGRLRLYELHDAQTPLGWEVVCSLRSNHKSTRVGRRVDSNAPSKFSGRLFFLPCVSFRRPHCLAARPARPSRRLLKTTSVGEGWRLGFSVTGDGQKTHSRAEKKRP